MSLEERTVLSKEALVAEVVYALVRTVGLILLLSSPYWYLGIIGFILIAAVPKPNPKGEWAWRFFSSDRFNWTLRIISELVVLAAALLGIAIFPYFLPTTAWWATVVAGVLSFAAYLYPFTLRFFKPT